MLSSQERVAWALAYVFFLIPHLMNLKTEFTQFHAKQSFFLFVIMIVSCLIPFFGMLIGFIAFCIALWSIYQAYTWNKFPIPYIAENMDRILSKIWFIDFFSAK